MDKSSNMIQVKTISPDPAYQFILEASNASRSSIWGNTIYKAGKQNCTGEQDCVSEQHCIGEQDSILEQESIRDTGQLGTLMTAMCQIQHWIGVLETAGSVQQCVSANRSYSMWVRNNASACQMMTATKVTAYCIIRHNETQYAVAVQYVRI